MGYPSSGDVSGRYSTNAEKKAPVPKDGASSMPWKYGRPNDSGHSRKASKGGTSNGLHPSDERPDSIYGDHDDPSKQRSSHK